MAQLAIKGHTDRGEEVIKILELLGGKNTNHNVGRYINSIYFINSFGYIEATNNPLKMLDYTAITLEEVEALMPYKIGDKVLFEDKMYEIIGMKWHECLEKIVYDAKGEKSTLSIFEPDKFKPVVNNEEFQNKLLKIYPDVETGYIQLIPHEDYEIKEINGDFVMVKKQPKYPKTYEECYDEDNTDLHFLYVDKNERDLYESFIRLIRCRDAYWKIAGEQMGLGKAWEPDWCSELDLNYTIIYNGMYINKIDDTGRHAILAFPTKVMRDAFYDNFKGLIEECKELL